MSDFAPFVAAVLEDEVLERKLKKVEALRNALLKLRRVAISGSNGIIVQSQLELGLAIDPERWCIDFPENSSSLRDQRTAVLKLGRFTCISLFGNCSSNDAFVENYDPKSLLMEIRSFYQGLCVTFEIQPVLQSLYEALEDISSEDLMNSIIKEIEKNQNAIAIKWKSVVFMGGTAKEALRFINSTK
jgi:hypothetical protein